MRGTELISRARRVPPVETKTPVVSVAETVPRDLAREKLACAQTVLGRDDRGEVATAHIANEPLGGRIDPPDQARLVEDVARDTYVLQGSFDIPADRQTR